MDSFLLLENSVCRVMVDYFISAKKDIDFIILEIFSLERFSRSWVIFLAAETLFRQYFGQFLYFRGGNPQ